MKFARASAGSSPAWLTNLALVLFGLLYIQLTYDGTHEWTHYIHGFSADLFGQLILYLGSIALIENSARDRWTLPILLAVAFGARLVAVFHAPFLSTDIYRYVWDGKVQMAGINPFRYIPADPHLAFLRDHAIYPHINRRSYAHTIYPPGSQFFYLLVDRLYASVMAMKLALTACEGVTCWAIVRSLQLLGQPAERVLLYVWNPVLIWEVASSGHIDGAALTVIAVAVWVRLRGSALGAAAWLASATLIKLYPVALLPAIVRKRVLAPALLFAGLVVGGYLPYLSVGRGVFGFLPEYAKEEGIESGARYFPLAWLQHTFHTVIPPNAYLAGCALVLAALAWWAFRRSARGALCVSSALVLATALNLCFSPHYPWYFLWLLPLLALWPWRPAFFLVIGATFLLSTSFGAPRLNFAMNERLYGVFILLCVFDLIERRWSMRKQTARPERTGDETREFAEIEHG